MTVKERIALMVRLGEHLRGKEDELLQAWMSRTQFKNAWFTIENQQSAITAIAEEFLQEDKLLAWLAQYELSESAEARKVGLVLAGNIPLVGFHDILCVFLSGHISRIKLSSKDEYVLAYLIKLLVQWDERANAYFEIVDKLTEIEAVIATGSNNSARYFETYFSKYPHIIRKNRNAVAVLSGQESTEELHNLGKDVFRYFGLGCRNVSKLYVPATYDFEGLLTALHEFRDVVRHSKYKNNFDYNYAMYLLNKEPFLANGCILLREDEMIASRIANLNYEFYSDLPSLESQLKDKVAEIQCVVAQDDLLSGESLPFGTAQSPTLADYADGVDTLQFLLGLRQDN